MAPGRQSKALLQADRVRLSRYQNACRLTVPQLKLAMAAPFKWGVLQRALRGEPIWILNHNFIVEWLDVHCPEANPRKDAPQIDGKSAASGEREESAESTELISRERD